jgi:hypothetical protein
MKGLTSLKIFDVNNLSEKSDKNASFMQYYTTDSNINTLFNNSALLFT